ncbi:hypothetical protein SPLC1_S411150 [Arthrospira platensis C1]|nr:hypothetical protein SPLC1_S411150 [Arthrospira platensis C1]
MGLLTVSRRNAKFDRPIYILGGDRLWVVDYSSLFTMGMG